MRRDFYLGFGVILIAVLLALVIIHHGWWFLVVLIPLVLVGAYDRFQRKHSILRNFPILGHFRFILEFFRPEIQQYFIANDREERPYDRETRTIVYERAKNVRDTVPFGTQRDILLTGYEWALHSLNPKRVDDVKARIDIGGPDCKKPYSASRLNISGMSFGALSANAILALNKGAKAGGFYHNTGEGGLSDYHLAGGGDIVWQLGTAYFGCRDKKGNFDAKVFAKEAKNEQVRMIEIKLSQGAKPSHGGILPAAKLTAEIARIRKVDMGQDVLSPPAHSAFTTPLELMAFITQLRKLSEGKPIGFKLCIGQRAEFMAICKAMLQTGVTPDFITVDGAEGGTGAAPMEFANYLGLPLNEGLSFVHNVLVGTGLRERIKIICSGKIATGFDMVCKMALGADLCNVARAFMMSVGCIQSRQCNANTCPTGVATQDRHLQKGLVVSDKYQCARQFHDRTMHSFLEIIGAMGVTNPSDIRPEWIMRRVSHNQVLNYRDIYEYVEPEGLLKGNACEMMLYLWGLASADSFNYVERTKYAHR